MRSNELAQLAGVSVRTLRHYHAIGLLPEPPRTANDYRDYGADHLVRLLRIKRLSSLGFPLQRIGEVLDDGPSTDDALDELDRELTLQIERLEEQRRTIALLKQEQLDPDLPVRFARIVKPFVEAASTASLLSDTNREALLVAGHLYTEEDTDELERVISVLEKQARMDQTLVLQEHFDRLPADATPEQVDQLVAEGEAWFEPIIDCFDAASWESEPDSPIEEILDEMAHRGLNEAQAYAQDRLMELLKARIVATENASDASTTSPQGA